ncbi:MAG TPA: DmsE family decaheme c-type cytochrome [Vicinamibacteria bacterium]|nr:DmsE family decaheme c-type cytochrome [Vicinamibacteria bacterium]
MRAIRFGLSAALLVVLTAPGSARANQASDAAKSPPAWSAQDCKACHEGTVGRLEKTRHATVDQSCQACHANVAEHVTPILAGGEPGPAPTRLGKAKAADVNATCLDCHEKQSHPTWVGSAHDRRGVSCTDCHSIHAFKRDKGQLKTAQEPDTCYTCHTAIRAQSLRTSHHPVREGLMTCTSCHNPHDGSKPKMIKAEYTNELCLQCHTEKRGPFFWEHAPVRENCLNCHNPHGSNHDKMLVSQQPWLCQRCHLNTRHPGTLYSNVNSAGEQLTASNRATEHACKNCHQNVHGGNAPTAPYLGR